MNECYGRQLNQALSVLCVIQVFFPSVLHFAIVTFSLTFDRKDSSLKWPVTWRRGR